jgi:hypothetical protein
MMKDIKGSVPEGSLTSAQKQSHTQMEDVAGLRHEHQELLEHTARTKR